MTRHLQDTPSNEELAAMAANRRVIARALALAGLMLLAVLIAQQTECAWTTHNAARIAAEEGQQP